MKSTSLRRTPPVAWLARAPGFTLVELLVVMVMLSMLMLAMASALRTASQTESRVDLRLERVDDLRVTNEFLRSIMGRVSQQKTTAPVELGSSAFYFSGNSADMSWVGVMPARYGVAGRYHFRLSLTPAGELSLQYMPWVDASSRPDWAAADSQALLKGVESLAFQYADVLNEPVEWTSQWTVAERMPERVLISLSAADGPWPDLVIAMRSLPATNGRSSAPSFGGGGS
jgi:general secretion pathway protein J